MKKKNLILGAVLLLLAVGCNKQGETGNGASNIASTNTPSAPVMTNGTVNTNK